MLEPKRRIGRPRKKPIEGLRHNMTFRITELLRARVFAASESSGRSMSEEIEHIVEAHFSAQDQRTIIREEIRAALGRHALPTPHLAAAHDFRGELYRIAHMGQHSHIIHGDDGSVSSGGLTVSPVQSQIYDRSALNGKQ